MARQRSFAVKLTPCFDIQLAGFFVSLPHHGSSKKARSGVQRRSKNQKDSTTKLPQDPRATRIRWNGWIHKRDKEYPWSSSGYRRFQHMLTSFYQCANKARYIQPHKKQSSTHTTCVHWKTSIQELLQFDEIFLSGGIHDQEPIHYCPYKKTTAGQQLCNTQTRITNDETIDAPSTC